ncbi:ribonuclease P protein component [Afifella pfennigii]|uniref:ribonuclease P protein component n=1 Tax=Afifella pfennigii TaxID=209897 RepID=UPI00054D8DB4|nr:ribonuclease P protein component [Afifella pfennigii]
MQRLKKRRDFLAVRGGRRQARRAFILESRQGAEGVASRVGFTVSRRVSPKAVIRNRIRRRLKEAFRRAEHVASGAPRDHVVIARPEALRADFAGMVVELEEALAKGETERPEPAKSRQRQKRGRGQKWRKRQRTAR